ncbi:MAG: hypothetical protein KDB07_06050, partial [Planctomycetes bacterium]|nr:hypothetical protein [Planctomycetota bacterium]
VQLSADAEGKVNFEKAGIPVGTWTIILQVANYAPVTHRNVKITRDQSTELKFVLEPSGHVEIQFLNDNLNPSAAQDMRYTIKDSTGAVYERRFTFADLMRSIMNPVDSTKKNTFVLYDFPPDTYTMELTMPGYQMVNTKFTIKSRETTPLKITLVEE